MRFGPAGALLMAAALAAPVPAAGGQGARKPRLDVRASPRLALIPVDVFVIAELVGGDETEEFYCPAIEWEWGDGNRSAHEADCPPFRPGMAVTRLHTASHEYRRPGAYSIRVTLRRVGRALAAATTHVDIR